MTRSGERAGGKRQASKPGSKKKPAIDNANKPKRLIDIVDEAGKESFPASDPPPWNP